MPPQENIPTPAPEEAHNPLSVMQPGEKTLFVLKRHPIGIIITYAMTALVLFALAVMALVIAPSLTSGSGEQVRAIGAVLLFIFIILSLVFNLVATIVYWGNRWILTDDSITQISQTSLFHKESSQLGLESLEDVTAEKQGILTHIFNYGTLKAETAGHRSKFVFPYAPNPEQYAKQILEAHEKENNSAASGQRSYSPPAQQPPAGPGY